MEASSISPRRLLPFSFIQAPPPLSPSWCPSALDGLETNVFGAEEIVQLCEAAVAAHNFELERRAAETELPETLEVRWRHAGWAGRRRRVKEALRLADVGAARQRRFCGCGRHARVFRSPSAKKIRVRAEFCRDRWCLACGRARSARMAANAARWCDGKEMWFVTLTLRHRGDSLRQRTRDLWRYFRRLRHSEYWAGAYSGGVAFMEIKRSQDGKDWHPHIHVLCEGKYLDDETLSGEWRRITGDSFIVKTLKVRDAAAAAAYVAKYASKPADPSIFRRVEWIAEAVKCLHGRRLATTFGEWRGMRLMAKPADPGDWVELDRLWRVLREGAMGCAGSVAVLRSIAAGLPDLRLAASERRRRRLDGS